MSEGLQESAEEGSHIALTMIRMVSSIDGPSVTGFGLKLAARHLGEQKRLVPRTNFRGVNPLPH